jgi:hypothetical protein
MKIKTYLFSLITLVVSTTVFSEAAWHSLFDGKSLSGWRPSENKDTWSVQDGTLKTHGARSHLFYVGSVANGDFKNFELKAKVRTHPTRESSSTRSTRKKAGPKRVMSAK